LSRRAFFLHFLLVTAVPACLVAGWWQVHRALSGNLLSYFYSVEWPIFALLGVRAWWQLVHDERVAGDFDKPSKTSRSFWHRDDEVPSPTLIWDKALESPELVAYNNYLHTLSAGQARKTWRNPRGLPAVDPDDQGRVGLPGAATGGGAAP
jgi:DNA-binding transcriptional regulator of glucitol operon